MSTAAREAGPEPRLDRVVIVGASLAGLRTAEALRRKGFTGELILVGDEVHPPYDRPPLSKEFTAKAMSAESLHLRQNPSLEATWQLGVPATSLDAAAHVVTLGDGAELGYDGLVIATGATPRRLPGLPGTARGLHHLRTVDDALRAPIRACPREHLVQLRIVEVQRNIGDVAGGKTAHVIDVRGIREERLYQFKRGLHMHVRP